MSPLDDMQNQSFSHKYFSTNRQCANAEQTPDICVQNSITGPNRKSIQDRHKRLTQKLLRASVEIKKSGKHRVKGTLADDFLIH